MRALIIGLLKGLSRVRIRADAEDRLPAQAVVYAAGHHSRLDVLLAVALLPGNATVIVPPAEYRSRALRWLMKWFPHEVLDVAKASALKPLLRLLRGGRSVVVFPEGRRVPSIAVAKVYPVPALAALRAGAAIVPTSIRIERSANPLWRLMRVPARITLTLRASRQLHTVSGNARQRRQLATRELMAIMQETEVCALEGKPLYECFLDACARLGRRAPLIEDEKQGMQNYGAVLRASLALSRLLKRKTANGEAVGVLLPNVPVTVQTVLGLSAAGRTPVMFNYSGGVNAIGTARIAADVKTVVTSRRFIEQARLDPLMEMLRGCAIVYLEDLRSEFGFLDKLWLVGYALRFPRRVIATQSASDPAVVLFTSGSDGDAKGVVLSHRAIIANVTQIRAAIEFTPADKILNPLPLYHAYSFTAGMVLPLITGTQLHLYISPLHYRAIPEIAYRHDCTVLFGTSTFLSYYAAYANSYDFSRIRYVISGGEKLSPEVARVWMEKFGLRIFEGYGCTECAPVISLATPSAHRAGTVGHMLAGMDYHLEPVPGIDWGGILHLRGPNVMLGYLLKEEPGVVQPCASVRGEGWYDTGDVVELDQDGFVRIHGRMRRFAKIAGEMISLDNVEQLARAASPGHFHAAVLSVEEYGGETTVLFTTDAALDRIALQKAARAIGSRDLAVAREIVYLRELPMLRTGKTDYANLAQMARSHRPRTRDRFSPLRAAPVSQEERYTAPRHTGVG
jgi:acyl-[acyl-carrier-protein]-phospholipid O-acyltransferase/long-chain-fatty-acid--[acyl-carrier-protein] ligase